MTVAAMGFQFDRPFFVLRNVRKIFSSTLSLDPVPYLISPMALAMLAGPLTTCFLPLSRITAVGVERTLSS